MVSPAGVNIRLGKSSYLNLQKFVETGQGLLRLFFLRSVTALRDHFVTCTWNGRFQASSQRDRYDTIVASP